MLRLHAARHILVTTALVVAVCATIGLLSLSSYRAADASLAGLTEVVHGTVTPLDATRVRADWRSPSGAPLSAEITLAVNHPTGQVPAAIAYDPANPTRAVVPGAQVFADADRAFGGMVFAALIALLTVVWVLWLAVSRALLLRRPTTPVTVRRVRIQRGLLTRSYLETEQAPHRWIPVYFDPALLTLPTPTELTAHGDPRKNRLVAFTLPTTPPSTNLHTTTQPAAPRPTTFFPSGRVRTAEPPGRRTDNAAQPDPPAHLPGLPRQFRADAAATATAPLVGLFWAFIDTSGFTGWLAATSAVAALALWLWSTQGSDPT